MLLKNSQTYSFWQDICIPYVQRFQRLRHFEQSNRVIILVTLLYSTGLYQTQAIAILVTCSCGASGYHDNLMGRELCKVKIRCDARMREMVHPLSVAGYSVTYLSPSVLDVVLGWLAKEPKKRKDEGGE